MKTNGIKYLILFALAGLGFSTAFDNASAQNRSQTFSHSTSSHKKTDCKSCHKNPTSNWTTARGYPDVADYPGHDSCVQCHRNEFFRGNRPAICAVCHVSPGPRGKTRFPFPVKTGSQEFETIFPHDLHQNIIAQNNSTENVAPSHFTKVNFQIDDDKQFNNCAICHKTAEDLPKYAAVEPKSVELLVEPSVERFLPKPGFFKDMPDNHSSCFTCHYQEQAPIRTDCAGCHRLTSPYFESSVVKRYSIKFDHLSENHSNKDCTTCHVRITRTSDLKFLQNADVPLLTCSTSSCHVADLRGEVELREKSIADKTEIFRCTHCHSSAIGSYEIPKNHLEQAR